MTWNEQHFGRGAQDLPQGEARTRSWNVSSTVDVAKTEPEAPSVGDTHPDYPDLSVGSVVYSPTGFGCVVRANYLPPEYIHNTFPEDIAGPEYSKIDTTFEDVDVRIPIFELVSKKTIGADNIPVTKEHWRVLENTTLFRYTRVVHRITINAEIVSSFTVQQQLNLTVPISNQVNKLHKIGGLTYLFKSDGIRRLKKDQYQFTYRWIFDPGIPNTLDDEYQTGDHDNLAILGTLGFPYIDEDYIVPPYHRMSAAADQDSPTKAPRIVATPQYVEDFDGYLTLPGVS